MADSMAKGRKDNCVDDCCASKEIEKVKSDSNNEVKGDDCELDCCKAPGPTVETSLAPVIDKKDDCCSDCGDDEDEKVDAKSEGCCSDCEDEVPKAVKDPVAESKGCCSDCEEGPKVVKEQDAKSLGCCSDCEDPKEEDAKSDGCCSDCEGEAAPKKEAKGARCCTDCEGGDAKGKSKSPEIVPEKEKDDCCSDCDKDDSKDAVSEGCCSDCHDTPAVKDDCCSECPARDDASELINVEVGSCIPDASGTCQRAWGQNKEDVCCSGDKKEAGKAGDCCATCNDDVSSSSIDLKKDAEKGCGDCCEGESTEIAPVDKTKKESCHGLSTFTIRNRHGRKATVPKVHDHDHTKHSHSATGYSALPSNLSHRVQSVYRKFYIAACCCVAKQEVKQISTKKNAHVKFIRPKVAPGSGANHPEPHAHTHSNATAEKLKLAMDHAALPAHLRMLMLSVAGMDCPSCASRVTKALLTLPSVQDAKVNSFTGEANMKYDPNIITCDTVAKKVTTLTGFGCTVENAGLDEEMEDSEKPKGKIKTLRLIVSGTWDEEKIAEKGVHVSKGVQTPDGGTTVDVKFDPTILGARDVMNFFVSNGAEVEHVPTSTAKAHNGVQRDLVDLTRRVCLSVLLTIPVLVFAWAPLPDHEVVYGSVSLAFTTLIQLFIAAPIYSSALRSLFLQHILDMDLLVVMSTTIAYIYSIAAFAFSVAGKPFSDEFFETSALLITLILLGRLVTTHARKRANGTLDGLKSLQVDTVYLVDSDGSSSLISKELVHLNDTLRVSSDSTMPTDGVVVRGTSQADESTITGESVPVDKHIRSEVTAGTLNLWGVLDIKVNRLPTESTVTDIERLLAEAQESRLPVQDIADRVAAWVAPVVLAIAIITFIIWILVGLFVRDLSNTQAAVQAVKYSIAVLVVACPCAIVLCVPMVIVIAMGVAAKKGVIFKSAEAVQEAKNIDTVVFDKTGTLTNGQLDVVKSHFMHVDASAISLALLEGSNHPVAKAILSYLRLTAMTEAVPLSNAVSIPGCGVEATYDGKLVRGGNLRWLGIDDISALSTIPTVLKESGLTTFGIKLGEQVIAVFGLKDTVRNDAKSLIDDLINKYHKEIYIVSGDTEKVVKSLAIELGVPTENAVGGYKPVDKQDFIKKLQQQQSAKKVLFVGDGTNDSLALIQANIGVSLSSGTDIAVSAADIVLISPTPLSVGLHTVLDVSKRASNRIKFNFGWSFVYNLVAISFAGGAFVKTRLSPQFAGLGEMVSVLPVVMSAWSLWLK